MLKKITIALAVLLAVSLIATAILLPVAVRSVLRDGEKTVAQFIRSSSIVEFDAVKNPVINMDVGCGIFVEQSPDEKIYLKIEGLFADQMEIASSVRETEDGDVLDIYFDYDEAFWETENASYLFRRVIGDSSMQAAILRVPENVTLKTSSPWNIQLGSGVHFANDTFYREDLWAYEDPGYYIPETDAPDPVGEEVHSSDETMERLGSLMDVFESELSATLITGYALDESSDQLEDQLDLVMEKHYTRISGQIYPYVSDIYDETTLDSMLHSAMTLRTELYKAKVRYELDGGKSWDSEAFDELQDAYNQAEDLFYESYRKYINEVSDKIPVRENQESLPEKIEPKEAEELSESLPVSENTEDTAE